MQKLLKRFKGSGSPQITTRTLTERQHIADDTLARTDAIIQEYAAQGASSSSTFIASQLEELKAEQRPSFPPTSVEIVNTDAFTLARKIIAEDPAAKGATAVLNLASDQHPAGGWLYSLSKTQEEALCYSSTLYATLKEEYYPWPNVGLGSVAGVYSPGVVIFKHDLDNDCRELSAEERQVVSVITVAAPRHRRLTPDKLNFENPAHLDDLNGKIRLVYRMAAHNGQRYLVLGAMGCGAYACPPRLVAERMRDILLEQEFKGAFARVAFAVYSKGAVSSSAPTNFDIFSEVFKDITIN